MPYFLDLKSKSIQVFKDKLKDAKLLPSQKILEDKLDECFEVIEKMGFVTMHDIQVALKNKPKSSNFQSKVIYRSNS